MTLLAGGAFHYLHLNDDGTNGNLNDQNSHGNINYESRIGMYVMAWQMGMRMWEDSAGEEGLFIIFI